MLTLNILCNEYKLYSKVLFLKNEFSSVQLLSHVWLFATPGLPVHHQLPEFTQTHAHRVSDAIQPSHSLLSPSPPALNPSQHQVFSNESTLRMRWPKYWSFSFSIIPSKSMDFVKLSSKEDQNGKLRCAPSLLSLSLSLSSIRKSGKVSNSFVYRRAQVCQKHILICLFSLSL